MSSRAVILTTVGIGIAFVLWMNLMNLSPALTPEAARTTKNAAARLAHPAANPANYRIEYCAAEQRYRVLMPGQWSALHTVSTWSRSIDEAEASIQDWAAWVRAGGYDEKDPAAECNWTPVERPWETEVRP